MQLHIHEYSSEYQNTYREVFQIMRKEPARALQLMEPLFAPAEARNDLPVLAELYFAAGNASFMLSDSQRSLDLLKEAVRCYSKLDMQAMVVKTKSFIGILHLHQGDFADSIETFTNVMEIAKELDDQTSLYKAYSQLGQCYAITENWMDASINFLYAHRILQKHEEVYEKTESVPIFYCGYIETCARLGDFDKAEELIQEKDAVISRYPRFIGSPFDIWPGYCLEFNRQHSVSEELEQQMWTACTDEKYQSAEYFIVMTQYLQCEFDSKYYERAITLGKKMQDLLKNSDLDRRKMSVSRIIILSYQALGKQDEMCRETMRYFEYQDRAEKYTQHNLISYLNVKQENSQLMDVANTDELTGIYNRRALNEATAVMYETAYQKKEMFGYAMLDIDSFKQINDQHGHGAGDRALKVIGSVLANHSSSCVFPARYGGDEFTILFENLTKEQILDITKQIRAEIQQRVEAGECLPMTVSQGVYCVVPRPYLKEWQYHAQADKALYLSKQSRNGTIHLHTDDEELVAG